MKVGDKHSPQENLSSTDESGKRQSKKTTARSNRECRRIHANAIVNGQDNLVACAHDQRPLPFTSGMTPE
jgi:hypothetical protein